MKDFSQSIRQISSRISFGTFAICSCLLAFAVETSLFLFNSYDQLQIPALVTAIFYTLVCVLPPIAAMPLLGKAPLKATHKSNLYFVTGLLLWSTGEIIQVIWNTTRGDSQAVLSPASLFILGGYPAILLGIMGDFSDTHGQFGKLGAFIDIATTWVGFVALYWITFWGPLGAIEMPLRSWFWASVFPVCDFLLLITLLYQRSFDLSPKARSANLLLLLASLVLCLHDILYTFRISGLFAGTGYSIGYTGFLLGNLLLCLTAVAKGTGRSGVVQIHSSDHPKSTGFLRVLPFAVTIASLWFTFLDFDMKARFSVYLAISSGLGVLLLALRQGIRAGENEFQQYVTLVTSVAEPAFICDRVGRIILSNPALTKIMGVVPTADEPLFLANMVDGGLERWQDLSHLVSGGWSGEVMMAASDQRSIPVFLALRPVSGGSARKPLLAGTAHDLSDQKRQQAELQAAFAQLETAKNQLVSFNATLEEKVAERTFSLIQAKVQLEQQNQTLQMLDELKSDFVSLVSHELRAPLTNISTGIELVLDQPARLSEHTTQSLSLVQAEILRLNQFVESILDVNALDAGRTPFYANPLAIQPIIESIERQYAGLPDGERLVWQIAPHLPYVMGDDRALRSVFIHLIDNALKYAPEGEIRIETRTSSARRVEISVSDRGPGFPENAIPLLFDKFSRLQQGDAQVVYGHGLGLYIARRLLQAMDGDIRAENRAGGGACFTFWLNCLEDADGTEDLNRG